jgi:hypothetical protein
MAVVYEQDGLIITELDVPRWIEKLPSYGKWTRFLLAHGYARPNGHIVNEEGEQIAVFAPLDHAVARVREADGHTVIPCICCGTEIDQDDPFVRRHTGLVVVGGVIKTKVTDYTGPNTRTIRWTPRPVSKKGMGCKTCQALMFEAMRSADRVNAERLKQAALLSQIALLEAQIMIKQGAKPTDATKQASKRLPGPLTAMIDVFERMEVVGD